MVEAFTIERRLPDKRVGPAIVKSAWTKIATTDSFAERVHQGELAREHVWDKWARAGGALPYEVSRMEEALSWPGTVLATDTQRGQDVARMGVLRGVRPAAAPNAAQARMVAINIL